jgi:hypothetical protein
MAARVPGRIDEVAVRSIAGVRGAVRSAVRDTRGARASATPPFETAASPGAVRDRAKHAPDVSARGDDDCPDAVELWDKRVG